MFYFVKKVALLYGLLWVTYQTVAQENRLTCGRRKVKSAYLIHNGIDAKAGHWPWHAAIFHRKGEQNEYACGGAVIDENTILTAAHCIYTSSGILPTNLISVHLGKSNLKEENEYTQIHGVHELIVHPKYSSSSIINDIGLIKLSSNITMNKYVQPVCLWTMDSNQKLIEGTNGIIVGFGKNEYDLVSEQLKQVLIGVIDPLTCIASDRVVFGTHLTSEIYCGKGQMGVGACNGDSGGGMFFEVGGKWFVRGLVSFSPLRGNIGLCDPLKYTAYTDVAQYLEWIKQYIDQRVLSFENDVLDIDYEEKLRLFNFGTCGVKSSTMLNDGSSWTLPWLGFVIVSGATENFRSARCVVTLISDWYAIGPAHCFANDGIERSILLGGPSESTKSECFDRHGSTQCTYPTQTVQIERIITHPKYDSNNFGNNIVLIELLEAANTTQPNVKPICVSAIPELRTNEMTNLSVATYSRRTTTYGDQAVHQTSTEECMDRYADLGLTISWKNMRFCARTATNDNPDCVSLKSGAPLHQLRSLGGSERYFLRGFEILGLACTSGTPPAYNNINEYLDWILYNMRNEILATVDSVNNSKPSIAKQTLEMEWSMLQQQPGNEKMHLFDMNSCGLARTRNQNLGQVTVMPWIGFLETVEIVTDAYPTERSIAVLISEWYALTPKRSVQNGAVWRSLLLGQYNPDLSINCYTRECEPTHQLVEIRRIIIPSTDQPRQSYALLELLEPANLKNPFINPICMPFMNQLHRNKSTEVVISSNPGTPFAIESKKLSVIDNLSCQQRLLAERITASIESTTSCAIEADKFKQTPLASFIGSPLQMPVRFEGRTRYFLYGMDVNEPGRFSLMHGPYLFGTFELADLDWIVENMRENQWQTSFPGNAGNKRVNLRKVKHASKRTLFDMKNCGKSSSMHPLPWLGLVSTNAPYFNVTKCTVTLISEWYAIGSAHCFGDDIQEHFIIFGDNANTAKMDSSANNSSDSFPPPTQLIVTQKIFVHRQYNATSYDNDIALALLATPADTSQPNVKPICLPIIDTIRSYDTSSLVMAAFGSTVVATYSIIYVDDRYMDLAECQTRWQDVKVRFNINSSKHCVIPRRTVEDVCVRTYRGASFHSLQRLESSERHFLRGFAAILPKTCSIYYPIVYTNTDAYLDWILETMGHPAGLSFDPRKELIFSEK